MSFLRPAAASAIGRWAEPSLVGAGLLWTLWLTWNWIAAGSGFGWIALVLSAGLALWFRSALAGALSLRPEEGPGVVVLREGEVGYMGPQSGGFVDLALLERVEVVAPSRGEPLWYLDAGHHGHLIFPATAENAEHLIEALAALPGFSDLTAAQTLRAPPKGRTVVWQRSRAPGLTMR